MFYNVGRLEAIWVELDIWRCISIGFERKYEWESWWEKRVAINASLNRHLGQRGCNFYSRWRCGELEMESVVHTAYIVIEMVIFTSNVWLLIFYDWKYENIITCYWSKYLKNWNNNWIELNVMLRFISYQNKIIFK